MRWSDGLIYMALCLMLLTWGHCLLAQDLIIDGEIYADGGEAPDAFAHTPAGELHLAYKAKGTIKYVVMDLDGNQKSADANWGGVGNGWSFGPGIAVDGQGKRHLSYSVDLGGWKMDGTYVLFDGGWQSPVVLQGAKERGYASQVAADDMGATVVFHELEGNSSWINAYRVINGSPSGQTHKLIASRVDDRMDLIAGPGPGERHLFVGLPNPSGQILYAHSTDAGSTWNDLGGIKAGQCGARVGQPDAALGSDGKVHLVYGCGSDGDLGGTPSVRYARIQGTSKQHDTVVTSQGELSGWHLSLGIGRVAVTSGGTIAAAYLTTDGGELRVRSSVDSGVSWSNSHTVAPKGGDAEGRNVPSVAALENLVFIAYSDGGTVRVVKAHEYACNPDCAGKDCGSDGCGGSCGQCAGGQQCSANGACDCVANQSQQCQGGKLFWLDSCGNPGDLVDDCNDGNPCTDDGCANGACVNQASPCDCQVDADCDQGKDCQLVECVDGNCVKDLVAACCLSDTDCDTGNACLPSSCVNWTCQVTPVPGCCQSHADCVDNNACTADYCVEGACSLVPQLVDQYRCIQGKVRQYNQCGYLDQVVEDCGGCGCEGDSCGKASCINRECGDDGCGGDCGQCAPGYVCSVSGLCEGTGVQGCPEGYVLRGGICIDHNETDGTPDWTEPEAEDAGGCGLASTVSPSTTTGWLLLAFLLLIAMCRSLRRTSSSR